MADEVKPGPGQDIRDYSDEQVIDRLVAQSTRGGEVGQMAGELARRAAGTGGRR